MMIPAKNTRKWVIIGLAAIALVPVVITAYEVIFSKSESVTFLGNYHPKVAFLVAGYYVVLLCLGIFWFVRQLIFITRLKTEQAKAEMMLLKSQVSPHFFFNMLNNLYGLVAKDTPKAQELILKLSDMMRYSIYEGEKEAVTLRQEVDFMRNYIALHQMRYHKDINVEFNYTIDENRIIVPLLFIILLENAFKHGVENLRKDAYIKVDLTTTQTHVKIIVENNYENTIHEPGIGLKNLKRRLELTYPNQHELSFTNTGNVYRAELTLNNYDKIFNH